MLLKERWKKLEDQEGGEFYEWFCEHKAAVGEETMLKPIREDAGLGCPPQVFTTNASETANFILNNKVDYSIASFLSLLRNSSRSLMTRKRRSKRLLFSGESITLNLSTSTLKFLKVNCTSQQRRMH